MKTIIKRYEVRATRRGMAPLELAMLLPFMVALLVLLFYVGHAGSDQLELAQETHYKAQRVRYDDQPDDIKPLSYVEIEQGQIEDEEEGKVESGLIYDKWNHETKSEAQFYANAWNKNSKWEDESKWPGAFVHGSKDKEVLENNNQRIFYFQKNGQTYWSNLPYYEKTPASPVRNSDYVDPNTGNGVKNKTPPTPPDEDDFDDDEDEEDLEEEEEEEEEEPCGIEQLQRQAPDLYEARGGADRTNRIERRNVAHSGEDVIVEILHMPSQTNTETNVTNRGSFRPVFWTDCETGKRVFTIIVRPQSKAETQATIAHELTHMKDYIDNPSVFNTLKGSIQSEINAHMAQANSLMTHLEEIRDRNKGVSYDDWPENERNEFIRTAVGCYEANEIARHFGKYIIDGTVDLYANNGKDLSSNYNDLYRQADYASIRDRSVRETYEGIPGIGLFDVSWANTRGDPSDLIRVLWKGDRIPYVEIDNGGITHRYVYPEREFFNEVSRRKNSPTDQ